MWIAPSKKNELAEALFHYLVSVRDGHPRAERPLIAAPDTLRALYASPHPDLQEALRHCLDAFLVELGPDPGVWGAVAAPVAAPVEALGVALAALNCLGGGAEGQGSTGAGEQERRDLVGEFTAALIATLPPAREHDAALAYHAVLRGLPEAFAASAPGAPSQPAQSPYPQPQTAQRPRTQQQITRRPRPRGRLFHALIERSPLTALWALDVHTPSALDPLAAELLSGWDPEDRPASAWPGPDDWLETVATLLDDAHVARWARHRWLALPESRPACRNTGLLLEALRRRDGHNAHRDLLLAFYENYDYFRGETRVNRWGERVRAWPVVAAMEKLLTVPGDDELMAEAALRVNRRGNEYFLKFQPLLELVVAEGGMPVDYPQLTLNLVLTLRKLVPYTTEAARQRVSFEEIEFEEGQVKNET